MLPERPKSLIDKINLTWIRCNTIIQNHLWLDLGFNFDFSLPVSVFDLIEVNESFRTHIIHFQFHPFRSQRKNYGGWKPDMRFCLLFRSLSIWKPFYLWDDALGDRKSPYFVLIIHSSTSFVMLEIEIPCLPGATNEIEFVE